MRVPQKILILAFALFALSGSSGLPKISLLNGTGSTEISIQQTCQKFGKHYAFPDIRDWRSLRISLTRSACFGSCPDYTVDVDGNGNVRYEGRSCVSTKGIRIAKLPLAEVQTLFDAFRRADFFSLCNIYKEGTVDASSVELKFAYDKWQKHVVDMEDTSGMPDEAAKLPDLIDAATNTNHWIGHPNSKCMSE